jgi:hypothetical protein
MLLNSLTELYGHCNYSWRNTRAEVPLNNYQYGPGALSPLHSPDDGRTS